MSEYSIYPKAIDGYAQLPLAVDKKTPINAESVNRLRSAIINIEKALGISPEGEFASTSLRIGNLEDEASRLESDLLSTLADLRALESEVRQAIVDSAESLVLAEEAKNISQQAEEASNDALNSLSALEQALAEQALIHDEDKAELDFSIDAIELALDSQAILHSTDKLEIDSSIESLEAAIAGMTPGSSIDALAIEASIDALELALQSQVLLHSIDKLDFQISVESLEAALAGLSSVDSINSIEIEASIDALELALEGQVLLHSTDMVEIDLSIESLAELVQDNSDDILLTQALMADQLNQYLQNKVDVEASIDNLELAIDDQLLLHSTDKLEIDLSIESLEAAIAGLAPGSSIDTFAIEASIDALELALENQGLLHSVDKVEIDLSIDLLEAAIAGLSPGSSIDSLAIEASIDALQLALEDQVLLHSVDKLEIDSSIESLEADVFSLEADFAAHSALNDFQFSGVNASIDSLEDLILSVGDLGFELLGDETPQLGGNLDLNGSDITGSGSIVITGDIQADNVEAHLVGDLDGPIVFDAYANVALSKGDVVYISGISGNNPTVELAQANAQATMPAFGLAWENIPINTVGKIATFGSVYGLDASSIMEGGSAPTLGSPLYVSAITAGKVSETPPAGESNFIQNIGKAERVSPATNMTVKVGGAGRTNATPALDSGNIFYGNASNESVSVNLDTTIDSLGYAKLIGGTLEAIKVNPEQESVSGGQDLVISGGDTLSTSLPGGDLVLTAGDGPSGDGEISIGATSTTQVTVGASIVFNAGMQESFSVINGATGSVSHDCSGGHIFLHQGIVSNFTADLVNLALQANKGTTVTLVLGQGTTPFIANGLTINGTAVTILWQGGTPPTGGVGYDALSFSIMYDGSSYYVLGQLVEFG